MESLEKKLERLSDKQRLSVLSINKDYQFVRGEIKVIYDLNMEESISETIDSLESNRLVMDYIENKRIYDGVVTELKALTSMEENNSVKLGAVNSYLDRMDGKALTKTELSGKDGAELNTVVSINYIKPNDKD
ncbi:MAG: hypothetical protein U9R08_01030 [Nanoarchaeota archaeon]|nr:hypothetical protein [Nanoarchaeota archaeon]